jgi:outer membrane receptor protein involved in Fe transport
MNFRNKLTINSKHSPFEILTHIRPFLVVALLIISIQGFGQQKSKVTGVVRDSLSSQPLGYASISILSRADKKLINGTLSADDGSFSVSVPEGDYYAEVNFVGYKSISIPAFTVGRNDLSLGTVTLNATEDLLDEVVVQAEKSSMELSLDKRIFNVGKDLANSGGTASDILANIPSVAVDPEGNIKLRGSDNVKILIDGKPSGLVSFKGGAGLQQLQASMIERVEVITNPSARYEAEGLGGIINIVLKKEKNQGFNGSVDVIAGHPANYGLAANLNYRHRKVNFFINYGLAYRDQPGRSRLYQTTDSADDVHILRQRNELTIQSLNNNIRGGVDYYITEKDILTGSYLYRRSDAHRDADILYRDYLNSTENFRGYNERTQDEDEDEPNSEYSLIYKKIFEGKGHELLTEVKYLDNWESSDQTFTENFFNPDGSEKKPGTIEKSLNDESEKQLLFQVDYIRPIAKDGKFEAGFRRSIRDMTNDFVVTQKNDDGDFEPLPDLDDIFFYDETITAVYGILGNKSKWISYQGGLRAEWTDIKTLLRKQDAENPRNYSNLFPSAHVTFTLPKENSIQLSYSRRIRRPFYNDLSPFMTYADKRNWFSGNPDLNPEYSDVIDLGHIKYFGLGSLSTSLFTRMTQDKIDNIRRVDIDGNAYNMPENLVSETAYGVDVAGTFDFTKWWRFDMNFNAFYAYIDGSNIEDSYTTSTYSWFTRQTSRFTVTKDFSIQARTNYEAYQKTVQGSRKPLYYLDLSFSKDIMKGNGTLNLNILDVFSTRKMRSVSEGEIFYSYRTNQFRRRQINLSFSYRINRSKAIRKQQREESVTD